jgi:hypothetical protein
MRHVASEASIEAEASDQSRRCASTGRGWTGSFAGGKRIRIRSSDRRRSAISKRHSQSTLRAWRRGNGRCESCDIPPLRQGKRHRRLHAAGARRLRWMPWLWRRRWMSWLWRRSRLWLQRLRLRRLRLRRLGRLWFRRLLLIVGRLPSLLIRGAPCWASTSKDKQRCLAGLGKRPSQFFAPRERPRSRKYGFCPSLLNRMNVRGWGRMFDWCPGRRRIRGTSC